MENNEINCMDDIGAQIFSIDDINEYKNARDKDNINTGPTSKEEAMKKLYQQQKREEDESIALAFQLAKQNEKAQAKNKSFWGELKQITGW